MASRDQTQGFEREAKFDEILWDAVDECPSLKAKTVKKIIAQVNPEFMEGLFSVRPCVRKLRYIGDCDNDTPNRTSSACQFFKGGEVYESIDFTGATYSIVGYTDGEGKQVRIGYRYFEWVDDDVAGSKGSGPSGEGATT